MNCPSRICLLPMLAFTIAGCRGPTVSVAPIKIEPIHITMDINVKVDKQLDNFFDFEEEAPAPKKPAAPEPAPAPESTPTP